MVDIHHASKDWTWWQSTSQTGDMPKDRAADRHTTVARIIRPKPEELWAEAEAAVGNERSGLISALLAWYLRHEPLSDRWKAKRPEPPTE